MKLNKIFDDLDLVLSLTIKRLELFSKRRQSTPAKAHRYNMLLWEFQIILRTAMLRVNKIIRIRNLKKPD